MWCDVLKLFTAKVLCTYSDKYYRGRAAITVNQFGKGRVYYVGCDLDQGAVKELVRYISGAANICIPEIPEGVELVNRKNCRILLNYNDFQVQISLKGRSLITNREFEGILPPYGVEFLER